MFFGLERPILYIEQTVFFITFKIIKRARVYDVWDYHLTNLLLKTKDVVYIHMLICLWLGVQDNTSIIHYILVLQCQTKE